MEHKNLMITKFPNTNLSEGKIYRCLLWQTFEEVRILEDVNRFFCFVSLNTCMTLSTHICFLTVCSRKSMGWCKTVHTTDQTKLLIPLPKRPSLTPLVVFHQNVWNPVLSDSSWNYLLSDDRYRKSCVLKPDFFVLLMIHGEIGGILNGCRCGHKLRVESGGCRILLFIMKW